MNLGVSHRPLSGNSNFRFGSAFGCCKIKVNGRLWLVIAHTNYSADNGIPFTCNGRIPWNRNLSHPAITKAGTRES